MTNYNGKWTGEEVLAWFEDYATKLPEKARTKLVDTMRRAEKLGKDVVQVAADFRDAIEAKDPNILRRSMATTKPTASPINDILNRRAEGNFVAKWTLAELIAWIPTQPYETQQEIRVANNEAMKHGRDEYMTLHQFREEIEPWTEQEMGAWLEEQSQKNKNMILPILEKARQGGSRPYNVLIGLRKQVGDSGTKIGLFELAQAAWTGYSEGSIAADLPSAIRNLSNMK